MVRSVKEKQEDTSKRKRGRPKGSKNKIKKEIVQELVQELVIDTSKRKRGRPKGSKNKIKKELVKKLESDILKDGQRFNSCPTHKLSNLEQMMFKLPYVENPLMGTPKQVQIELDNLALRMQSKPKSKHNNKIFDKIHLYMHGYLINVVIKKFPFIRGFQTTDIYQETLMALRFKAIPGFKNDKGMSFLNFSKLCIRRHLITLLNASRTIKKLLPLNEAQSLDSAMVESDGNSERNTLGNIIADKADSVDKVFEKNEAFETTKHSLMSILSDFEKIVLHEYLISSSYKEIAINITKKIGTDYDTKSIDNALLRIRKKAAHLIRYGKVDDLPIFNDKVKN